MHELVVTNNNTFPTAPEQYMKNQTITPRFRMPLEFLLQWLQVFNAEYATANTDKTPIAIYNKNIIYIFLHKPYPN